MDAKRCLPEQRPCCREAEGPTVTAIDCGSVPPMPRADRAQRGRMLGLALLSSRQPSPDLCKHSERYN